MPPGDVLCTHVHTRPRQCCLTPHKTREKSAYTQTLTNYIHLPRLQIVIVIAKRPACRAEAALMMSAMKSPQFHKSVVVMRKLLPGLTPTAMSREWSTLMTAVLSLWTYASDLALLLVTNCTGLCIVLASVMTSKPL